MTGRLDERTSGDFGGCIEVRVEEDDDDDELLLLLDDEEVTDELSLREMDRKSGPVSGKDGRCREDEGRWQPPPRDLGRLEKLDSSALLTLTLLLLLLFWFLLFRLLLCGSDEGVLAAEAPADAEDGVEEVSPPGRTGIDVARIRFRSSVRRA